MEPQLVKVTTFRSDVVRNALSEDAWLQLISGLKCSDVRNGEPPHCTLSGRWWAKIDRQFDPPGEEHWRCPDCKSVFSIRVPLTHEQWAGK